MSLLTNNADARPCPLPVRSPIGHVCTRARRDGRTDVRRRQVALPRALVLRGPLGTDGALRDGHAVESDCQSVRVHRRQRPRHGLHERCGGHTGGGASGRTPRVSHCLSIGRRLVGKRQKGPEPDGHPSENTGGRLYLEGGHREVVLAARRLRRPGGVRVSHVGGGAQVPGRASPARFRGRLLPALRRRRQSVQAGRRRVRVLGRPLGEAPVLPSERSGVALSRQGDGVLRPVHGRPGV